MVKSVLYVTLHFEPGNDILPQDFIDNFCDKVGYRPENLVIEPYWKIDGQLQAICQIKLAENLSVAQAIAEVQSIAHKVSKEQWTNMGPDEDDEIVYELIYDGMSEEGHLKWAHLQLELPNPKKKVTDK